MVYWNVGSLGLLWKAGKIHFSAVWLRSRKAGKVFFFWEKKAGKLVYVLLEYGGKRGTRQPGSSRMVYKYVFFF